MGKLKPSWFTALLLFSSLLFGFPSSQAQQGYENNDQLACDATNGSSTLGYSCNGQRNSCSTFLIFRSQTFYQSPNQIASLLNANASDISTINGVANVSSPVPVFDLVVVPVACSCSGEYYQHNASYTIKSLNETYFILANETYQGLSACQALIAQNPYKSRNLLVGDKLVIPLRCACPTANQTAGGYKYLLTYLITWGDDVKTIAARFRTDSQAVYDANNLSSSSIIYPFTTLLVPLKTEPSKEELVNPPPPPSPPPPPPPAATSDKGSSNKKWIGIGIGIGVGVLAICGVVVWFLCWRRPKPKQIPQGPKMAESPSDAVVSSEVRGVIGSLTLYKFQELEEATGSFGEDRRIKGSVYLGVINGDNAAVKRLNGDVSNEIEVLKNVNHSNVIRLSGFCLHEGNTYLVYEFAEMGSLSDWLHQKKDWSGSTHLGWRQRVQIAFDVADGLTYLHNYMNPPYVHKNLDSSNILLDRELRAKLSNFGLARAVEDWEGPHLTRHVVGTQGYLAPEYLEHGLVTPKIDVFAFGVVMLELLSGKEATFAMEGDEKKEALLWSLIGEVLSGEDARRKLRGFVDPYLQNDYPFDLAFAMAELAMRCVERDPASRPTMTEVFLSLAAIHNSTLDWDPSDFTNSGSTVSGS